MEERPIAQLEIVFGVSGPARRTYRRRRRMNRAHWWFRQMRLAVDQAAEWEPARPAPAPVPARSERLDPRRH